MTFGEDPQLSIDMTRAMINAWQSTYDDDGNDLGWGKDSVNIQVKHIMSEGAGEAAVKPIRWTELTPCIPAASSIPASCLTSRRRICPARLAWCPPQ